MADEVESGGNKSGRRMLWFVVVAIVCVGLFFSEDIGNFFGGAPSGRKETSASRGAVQERSVEIPTDESVAQSGRSGDNHAPPLFSSDGGNQRRSSQTVPSQSRQVTIGATAPGRGGYASDRIAEYLQKRRVQGVSPLPATRTRVYSEGGSTAVLSPQEGESFFGEGGKKGDKPNLREDTPTIELANVFIATWWRDNRRRGDNEFNIVYFHRYSDGKFCTPGGEYDASLYLKRYVGMEVIEYRNLFLLSDLADSKKRTCIN